LIFLLKFTKRRAAVGLPGKPFTNKIGTMIDDDINGRVEELEKENKRLALQVEVLSAAFANSSEKEKSLMAEKAELVEALVEARLQIEYLEGKFGKTGTGTAAISRIERITGKYKI